MSAPARVPQRDQHRAGGRGISRRHSASANNDAESAGAPSGGQADQAQLLGHAGMVLRDPATFHLVIHQVGSPLMRQDSPA